MNRGQGSEVTEMVVVDWYRSTAYFCPYCDPSLWAKRVS